MYNQQSMVSIQCWLVDPTHAGKQAILSECRKTPRPRGGARGATGSPAVGGAPVGNCLTPEPLDRNVAQPVGRLPGTTGRGRATQAHHCTAPCTHASVHVTRNSSPFDLEARKPSPAERELSRSRVASAFGTTAACPSEGHLDHHRVPVANGVRGCESPVLSGPSGGHKFGKRVA